MPPVAPVGDLAAVLAQPAHDPRPARDTSAPTRTAMVRIYDPVRITHPKLREFAYQAAWISTVAETANDLEDLLVDVPPEERVLPDFSTPWPWDFDPLVVALTTVQETRQASERGLE